MLRDSIAVQSVTWFIDPKDIFILVSALAALTCFWTMQCITSHAGVTNGRRFAILMLRISFCMLALSLIAPGIDVAMNDTEPTDWQFLAVAGVLSILITLPFAIGGRAGAEFIAKHLS